MAPSLHLIRVQLSIDLRRVTSTGPNFPCASFAILLPTALLRSGWGTRQPITAYLSGAGWGVLGEAGRQPVLHQSRSGLQTAGIKASPVKWRKEPRGTVYYARERETTMLAVRLPGTAVSRFAWEESTEMHLIYGAAGYSGPRVCNLCKQKYPTHMTPRSSKVTALAPFTKWRQINRKRFVFWNMQDVCRLLPCSVCSEGITTQNHSTLQYSRQYQDTGCLCKGKSTWSNETMERARGRYVPNPRQSTPRATRELGIPQPTTYRLQLLQHLHPEDYATTVEICEHMQEDKLATRLVFSDEATFHLSREVNHHNVRIWGIGNHHASVQHVRDSPKLCVFCVISQTKVYGPRVFSLENTVTGLSYLDMLQLWLFPQIREDSANFVFQQDGAPPHWHTQVRRHLDNELPRRWIGRCGRDDSTPPRSPDLTPCDFFLWGHVTNTVYGPPLSTTLHELRNRITTAVMTIDRDMLQHSNYDRKTKIVCMEQSQQMGSMLVGRWFLNHNDDAPSLKRILHDTCSRTWFVYKPWCTSRYTSRYMSRHGSCVLAFGTLVGHGIKGQVPAAHISELVCDYHVIRTQGRTCFKGANVAARPRSRRAGPIRAAVTRTPSASSLLRLHGTGPPCMSIFICKPLPTPTLPGSFPFLPSFHSGAAPYSPHFTLIGSQDLAIMSRPNLFTNSARNLPCLSQPHYNYVLKRTPPSLEEYGVRTQALPNVSHTSCLSWQTYASQYRAQEQLRRHVVAGCGRTCVTCSHNNSSAKPGRLRCTHGTARPRSWLPAPLNASSKHPFWRRGHGGHQGDPGSIPGRATPNFRTWESCRAMPLVGGFSRGSPVPPALSFGRCSRLTSIIHIGSQDLDVKSRPNLFTHSEQGRVDRDEWEDVDPGEGKVGEEASGHCDLARAVCSLVGAVGGHLHSRPSHCRSTHTLASLQKTPVFSNTFIYFPRENVGLEDANRTTAYPAEGTQATTRHTSSEFDSSLVAPVCGNKYSIAALRWESCRTITLIGGFSRGSPVYPALESRAAQFSPHFTIIGSQDLVDPPKYLNS
ncbi:hypothetical protein PR048_032883 [Dryococelus australis]|uniref:Uncharacterized protein n=1 Tax=Dryococelus australis TaxID=614101 RepID=A0ABQ9G3H3_9NEOP|nr:hypothetical protein PR048_032883 [Dryococelus australis]